MREIGNDRNRTKNTIRYDRCIVPYHVFGSISIIFIIFSLHILSSFKQGFISFVIEHNNINMNK